MTMFKPVGCGDLYYDPVERHLAIEKLVTRGGGQTQLRRYYRFRADRWYGGISTADCAGCGLMCKFCWVSDRALYRPSEVGHFYAPREIASRLLSIANKKGLRQLRVSGGEPTIGRTHLLQLMDELTSMRGYTFILETNGILIGKDYSYAVELSKYPFLRVRVSIKGCGEHEFSQLTGAKPESFQLQLKALENLVKAHVNCHPAVMTSFSPNEGVKKLGDGISTIDRRLTEELEVEELILYPQVVSRLQRFRLIPRGGYRPDKVPPERV